MYLSYTARRGFTLIEMSIVLVIIGLIVGGVLVGQSLISAAAVRAQISQIEKYNTAVNTFYGKYNALPGDLAPAMAGQFGFVTGTGIPGDGDGNGLITGTNGGVAYGTYLNSESLYFWADLSREGLISGSFTNPAWPGGGSGYLDASSAPSLSEYFPSAPIAGNWIVAYSVNGINISQLREAS
jgi:prepilin-type N-terminal cleavage/methylation domain-containing protein